MGRTLNRAPAANQKVQPPKSPARNQRKRFERESEESRSGMSFCRQAEASEAKVMTSWMRALWSLPRRVSHETCPKEVGV